MENRSKSADAVIIKKIRSEMIIIAVLSVIIIVGMFLFFLRDKSVEEKISMRDAKRFEGPVPDLVATMARLNYSDVVRYTPVAPSKGVLYDTGAIRRYITDTVPQIIARHQAHMAARGVSIPANYEWKVSFYWMARQEGHDVKLGFYAIPVLVETSGGRIVRVFDYFESGFNDYYNHPGDADRKNIHDEGHLWP